MSRTKVLLHKAYLALVFALRYFADCQRLPDPAVGLMKPRAFLPPSLLLALVALLALASRPAAQATPDQAARFGARTEAVVVDVTVVDKKGRPVTTLTQSDFEVLEDGVPQTILTFDRQAPNPKI